MRYQEGKHLVGLWGEEQDCGYSYVNEAAPYKVMF